MGSPGRSALQAAMLLFTACGGADSTAAAPPGTPGPPARELAASPAASGAPRAAPPACGPGVPAAACRAPGLRVCADGDRDRAGDWRHALIGGPYDATGELSLAELTAAWRAGQIAATAETAAALAHALGPAGQAAPLARDQRPSFATTRWAIVPADELAPSWTVIPVAGGHPLDAAPGPLAVALCGAVQTPIHNIDLARVTTLVMSGTTALTGRIAERIDSHGIADTVRHIAPWFATADLAHISNEVSFVRDCNPRAGQDELKFCSRDRYIALLDALGTDIVELTGSHLIDHGRASFARTIAMYERRDWLWFGGGRSQLDATAPRLVAHHGNRFAFIGCSAVAAWVRAITPGAGVATCHRARLVWQIQDLRRRGYLPIVSVQHQEVRVHEPPPALVTDLRQLAEAGAAFVMGSQAHAAHPWDVHHGAYIHYGPGNILFAQHRESQRNATVDKLYFHAGRLVTVARLYTRIEHGRPRLLAARERTRFLDRLARAAAALPPSDPWAPLVVPPEPRSRPDSLIVAGRSQRLEVTPPSPLDPARRYPLIVDLAGTAAARPDAFVVVPVGGRRASGRQIAAFMRAKYAIDRRRIAILRAPRRR